MRRITLVKKIKADGSVCRKCEQVVRQLEENNQMRFIDQVVIADENDPASEGMQLARRYGVDWSPFFIVEESGKQARVYSIFLKFVREVLGTATDEVNELSELLDTDPGLEYMI